MPDVLFIDADTDLLTKYCLAFRQRFIFSFSNSKWQMHQFHFLQGLHAAQPRVDDCIKDKQIRFVSAAGHGLQDAFLGYDGDIIWNTGRDLSHMNDLIVHLLSCQTGVALGKLMVTNGVRAFWGYTEKFVLLHDRTPPTILTDDRDAEIFLKMDCIIDRGVLNGRSAKRIMASLWNYIVQALPFLPRAHRGVLLDNYYHLANPTTGWGDPSATI